MGKWGWGEGRRRQFDIDNLTIGGLHCNQGLAPSPWEQSCLKPDFSALSLQAHWIAPLFHSCVESSRGVGPSGKVPWASQRAGGGHGIFLLGIGGGENLK